MNIPPIYDLCAAKPELVALISDNQGLKISEFDATLDIKPPYVVWQIITANPEKFLDAPSDMDGVLIQIDIYAVKKSDARAIAQLVRAAISEDCYITSYSGVEKDTPSNLQRIRIDTSWYLEL